MENAPGNGLRSSLEELRTQHRRADSRLQELDRRLWLSTDEQMELARLKKRKLRLKDEMRSISMRSSVQPG